MACLDASNIFQRWVLTEEEQIQGALLTITQRQHIQNQIADLATQKVMLPRTADNMQEEAELQGSIRALQRLLDLSNLAEKAQGSGEEHHIVDPSGPQLF